jgi:hypothetical protein
MRRAVLLAAALALPLSGVTTVALAGEAGAATTIVCTTLVGTVSGTSVISGCTGGNTGGHSNSLSSLSLVTGGPVSWVSGSSTTFGAPVVAATSAKKCPGYVKGATTNPTADKISGVVSADTGDGIKVPGKFKGAVCISAAGGNLSLLSPMKIT